MCAIAVVWETVLSDLKELDAAFELARKETAKNVDCPPALAAFVERCEPRMRKLQENARIANVSCLH
jgi:gamma-glutamylcysteine synthetase